MQCECVGFNLKHQELEDTQILNALSPLNKMEMTSCLSQPFLDSVHQDLVPLYPLKRIFRIHNMTLANEFHIKILIFLL